MRISNYRRTLSKQFKVHAPKKGNKHVIIVAVGISETDLYERYLHKFFFSYDDERDRSCRGFENYHYKGSIMPS